MSKKLIVLFAAIFTIIASSSFAISHKPIEYSSEKTVIFRCIYFPELLITEFKVFESIRPRDISRVYVNGNPIIYIDFTATGSVASYKLWTAEGWYVEKKISLSEYIDVIKTMVQIEYSKDISGFEECMLAYLEQKKEE